MWPVHVVAGVLTTLAVVGWFARRFRAVAYLYGFRSRIVLDATRIISSCQLT